MTEKSETVEATVKFRLGLTDYGGFDISAKRERKLGENEDAETVLDEMIQGMHEVLHVYVEPFLPFLKLSYVDPETKQPLPHVQKLFMGVPVDTDEDED